MAEDRRAVGIAVGLHHDLGHELIGHAGRHGAVADRIGILVAAPSALSAATAMRPTIIVEATTSMSVRPCDFGFRISDFGLTNVIRNPGYPFGAAIRNCFIGGSPFRILP